MTYEELIEYVEAHPWIDPFNDIPGWNRLPSSIQNEILDITEAFRELEEFEDLSPDEEDLEAELEAIEAEMDILEEFEDELEDLLDELEDSEEGEED